MIVVYNFKGGEGKTRISLNLALELGFSIITNDVFTPIEKVLPEERLLKVLPEEEIPKLSKEDEKEVIFDLGGYPDSRVVRVLRKAKFIIVPVSNEEDNIQVAINSIDNISKYNKNILIVVNKTEKGDFEQVKKDLLVIYPNYKYFEIKKSRALVNISKQKKPVSELAKSPLMKHAYGKLVKQFDELINYLKD